MSSTPPPSEAQPSRAFRLVAKLARLLLGAFFRRVEVVGLENVPTDGGVILVSWHPNGIVDPALLFDASPRPVIFGARHGLFKVPIFGAILRATGAVPIYRAGDDGSGDPEKRRAANAKSLDALARAVTEGGVTCLFPEGDSHDQPGLLRLKTGLARFYYRARELRPDAPPRIVPVGLHYDEKHAFRSSALVTFHPAIALPSELDETPSEASDERREELARGLTRLVETTLHDAVHATESWQIHHLMHRARTLTRAERARRDGEESRPPTMRERTEVFARIWRAYELRRRTHPEEVGRLVARLREYDADLRALGLQDHELDRGPALFDVWLGLLLLVQAFFVYLLLPPLIFFGAIVNGPPAFLLWLAARAAAKRKKDEASIKLLLGGLLFPATWIGLGVAAAFGHLSMLEKYPGIPEMPVLAGVTVASFAFLGGAVALRYLNMVRDTARALRVRLTRHRRKLSVAHLLHERDVLHDALLAVEGEEEEMLP
ncbi:MAG: 1-acyl-sn-glycerol-3-phosphate acyltransferase [Polyangiales bacterium]